MEQFEVGERVVVKGSGAVGSYDKIQVIKEITKSGNYKLDNGEIFNKDGRLRGQSGDWYFNILSKLTPEIEAEILKRKVVNYMKRYQDWDKLMIEQLKQVYEIIKKEVKA